MNRVVKIGDKQKHLEIPEGFELITSGKVKDGDKFANVGNPNKPHWEWVNGIEDVGQAVAHYEAIIRRKPRYGC